MGRLGVPCLSVNNMFAIQKLLREPLLHFLLIGAGLFLVYGQMAEPEVEAGNRIVISQTDLERLAQTWLRRMGRLPSDEERQVQLESYIREQVLYREARLLGLDQDDIIVRRRLAQKMEFLFADLTAIDPPDDAALARFLEENAESFAIPVRLSFSHVYLDVKRHGDQVHQQASSILARLRETGMSAKAESLGDAIMLPASFSQASKQQLESLFGQAFAAKLFSLPTGQWQGPITSAYGLHLVKIQTRHEASLPALAEIRPRLEREWLAREQRKANDTFYQALRQRYDIVLEDMDSKTTRLSAR